MDAQAIEAAIVALLAARPAESTICPSEAARRLSAGDWRRLMPQVRETAASMAREGRLCILQRGIVLDPSAPLRGAIRLKRRSDNPGA